MSFANEVKKEICQRDFGPRHCLLAEAAAIFLNYGQIETEDTGICLKLKTDQYLAVKRFRQLILNAFGYRMQIHVKAEHTGKHRKYLLCLPGETQVSRVLQALKLEQTSGKLCEQDLAVNEMLLMSGCCKRAFLCGMFLGCGTMSTPEKNYHLEFVCNGPILAAQLAAAMHFFELEPKIVQRKNNQVVYIKEGRQVADMLKVMKATVSLLEYENIRIKREIRGNINRKVNCEAANISKTVAAAVEQIHDIELIRDTIGLNSLSSELCETALMRLQYTDIALRELGAMMNPPVGKSGMNHRFHKLKQMADEIRTSMEE
ncbi:MAG: DNA-binding protein WhiA [Lachnospiraceae bacterium]|nr:DNA-binding protein WhiA [Lachnospiraceae bacterium]